MDKKARFKAGLSFGIFMTICFILKEIFIEDDLTTKKVFFIFITACIGGAFAGLLFGWLNGLFAKSNFVSQTTKIDTDPDENILFETPANHFKGIEGVGGRLYLTNRRFIFKAHKLNIQNHELSIDLLDIKLVDRYKTLGLVNNGLAITTINEKTEKFVVEQVEEWVKLLTTKNDLHQSGVRLGLKGQRLTPNCTKPVKHGGDLLLWGLLLAKVAECAAFGRKCRHCRCGSSRGVLQYS